MSKPIQLDTSLSEFTYTVAREAPTSLKRLLPEKYYRAIQSESGAMKFATKATFEEKRKFFAYLGLEHFSIFVDMKRGAVNDFLDILKQFNIDDKPTDTLRKLAEENVFISSNKQLCYQLGFLSQAIDTELYAKNMEMIRTGYHIKKFKTKITQPEYDELNEEKKHSVGFAKIMHGLMWANDMCQDFAGISSQTMRLLIYFYINRNLYIPYQKISDTFAGGLSRQAIVFSRKELLKSQMIQKHPAQGKQEWTITGRGILVVNQFRDKVIKSFDF